MDEFLFGELKTGNTRAFDKIFNDHYKNLCRFAYSFVRDEDSAHSLVQHVFIKLWENRSSLDHVDQIAPYLTSMVKNHCINFVNREKRIVKLSETPDHMKSVNTTEHQVSLNELEEKLIIAIAELPARCKTAFEYSRFENYSNKDIAQKMEISVKGVEGLIGRALKLLRVSLAEFLPSSKYSTLKLLAICILGLS